MAAANASSTSISLVSSRIGVAGLGERSRLAPGIAGVAGLQIDDDIVEDAPAMPRASSSATRRRARHLDRGGDEELSRRRPGAITVPMSRPSSTAPPRWSAKLRWRSSSRSRTAGIAEIREAIEPTTSERKSGSSSETDVRSQARIASNSLPGSPPKRNRFSATAR
jgi:hypothetical protein